MSETVVISTVEVQTVEVDDQDISVGADVEVTVVTAGSQGPAGGGGGSGHTIQDEGVSLTARTYLNFVGANVTVTDDAGNDATVVTISGSGGGGAVWGSITGTLSNQTDLVAALAAKANISDLAAVAFSGVYSDLTGTPTIPSAIFSTIAVATQSNVVADSATDTLTLVAGAGMSITTDASTDTITFTNNITQYTDELAQDAVGGILTDTATIDLTYNDGSNTITADIKANSVTVAMMTASTTDVVFGRATSGAGAGEEIAFTAQARQLSDDTSFAAMRVTLGLEIGVNVQAYDATLAALAAYNTNGILVQTAADTFAGRTITGTSGTIVVTNGSGVSGNPTIDIGANVLTNSSTHTLTNKTIDANATGNSITNLETADFAANVVDTDVTLAADSDTRLATQHAVKTYVDNLLTGLSWKQAVRVATTASGTLASDFENGDTVDGVTLATGDRILIKNQSSATENGIYIVAASGAPARSSDANTGVELVNATVFVSEGTANADTQWTCTNNTTITIGVTNIAFAQVSGAGTYTAGFGLTLTGNSFAITDAELVAIAGLTSAADSAPYFTGSGTAALMTVTSAARTVLDDASTAAMLSTLGGQPLDATLTALAAYNTNGIICQTAADTFVGRTLTGTTDRITITNGTGVSGNPTVDIASTYVGQATITTVGTVTTGTWSGLFGAVTGANLTNLTAANIAAGTAGISITGNAATVTVADAGGDTTTFPMLATAATGSLAPATDAGLSYNATTNALTTTTFIGALTGNADTATTATNIGTATEATDTTCFLVFVTASGTQTLPGKTNTGLTYNSNTNAVGATTFVGALSGNATTATASTTSTVVNEATDTTCFVTFVTAATGDLGIKSNTNFIYNSNTGLVGITGALGVDNININGNSIISTDTNGNITIFPNGTGVTQIGASASNCAQVDSSGILTFIGTGEYRVGVNKPAFAAATAASAGLWFSATPSRFNFRDTSGTEYAIFHLTSAFDAIYGYSAPHTSPAQLTANTDNLDIGQAGVIRLSSDASRNLTGIVAPAGPRGKFLLIYNVGSQNIVLINDATSTAANRFLNTSGANITLTPNQGAYCWYDITTARWRASQLN